MSPPDIKLQRKRALLRTQDMHCAVRVYYRKARGNKGARYLLKCGCCNKFIEIYPGDPAAGDLTLEINGVAGSIQNWREILIPLLG